MNTGCHTLVGPQFPFLGTLTPIPSPDQMVPRQLNRLPSVSDILDWLVKGPETPPPPQDQEVHAMPLPSVARKRGRKKKAPVTCAQCLLTQTPEWRRGPKGSRTLCNACGLYYLKLVRKFGSRDAERVLHWKKMRNEENDRIVPTRKQKQEIDEVLSDWSGSLSPSAATF